MMPRADGPATQAGPRAPAVADHFWSCPYRRCSEAPTGLDPAFPAGKSGATVSLEGETKLMRRRSSLALTAVLVLAALPAAAVPALARDSAQARHERVVAYWTPARLKAAVPRDFVKKLNGTFQPRARPKGVGSVAGADWPNGQGQVYRTVGKVFFSLSGGNYVCSGAVATDGSTTNGRSLVLTAGHCAYDEVK